MLQKEYLDEAIECEQHAGQQAIGLCIVCGKPVCGDCATTVSGKTVCDLAEHQTLAQQWSVVHASTSAFEAELIARNLLQANIPAKAFAFRDHVELHWFADADRAIVLVPSEQLDTALTLLHRLQLNDSSSTS
jgi:hypothetical protein